MNKGTGYIGTINPTKNPEKLAQAELYGGLMSTPNYENIGAQGMQGLFGRQAQMMRQTATDKVSQGSKGFDMSAKLRGSFENQAKDFIKVRDANRRIGAAAETPTAAGDMALIFNFMKVLDPGSTVREGEFATAQQTTGLPDRVVNLYNNLMSGMRLNPTQRLDFVGQANNLYKAQLGGLEQLETQYFDLATRFGLDPKNVVIDYRVKPKKTDKKASKKTKGSLMTPATPPPPKGFN